MQPLCLHSAVTCFPHVLFARHRVGANASLLRLWGLLQSVWSQQIMKNKCEHRKILIFPKENLILTVMVCVCVCVTVWVWMSIWPVYSTIGRVLTFYRNTLLIWVVKIWFNAKSNRKAVDDCREEGMCVSICKLMMERGLRVTECQLRRERT